MNLAFEVALLWFWGSRGTSLCETGCITLEIEIIVWDEAFNNFESWYEFPIIMNMFSIVTYVP